MISDRRTAVGKLASTARTYARTFRHNYDNTFVYRHAVSRFLIAPLHGAFLPNDGIEVMEADWDTLVVLDACRADLFEGAVDVDEFDDYERVESLGSATPVWGRANFTEAHGDTVYVNANPHLSPAIQEAGGAFHEMIDVWETAFDEALGTVRAEDVVEAALAAHEEYPNKRLVVHFMQPHFPFLRRADDGGAEAIWQWRERRPGEDTRYVEERPTTPFDALEMGALDEDEVWEAYEACLRYAMGSVRELLEAVDGRSVITSDHGNCLGERQWPIPIRQYGHPKHLRSPELVTVPWAVRAGDGRRRVTDEGVEAVSIAAEKEAEIADRLEQLGYR